MILNNSNQNDTTNLTKILVGVDVHTTNFAVSFFNTMTGEFLYEREDLPARNEDLLAYIKRIEKRHFSDGNYEFHVGYEAGYTGYSTSRYLKEHNIDCTILAPNSIKRSPKERKRKSDKNDARLIAQTLFNRDYSEVKVPTPEEESLAHLTKYRGSITKSITQLKNQITSLLAQKNFKSNAGKWSEQYLKEVAEFIEQDPLVNDVFVLEEQLDELEHLQKRLERVETQIKSAVEEDNKLNQDIKNLLSLKGIGLTTAVSIAVTAKDANRFESADSFANYLGLTPGEKSSGKKQSKLGITKNGNSYVRGLLMIGAKTYSKGSPNYKSKDFLKNQEGLSPEMVEYSNRAYKRLHKKYIHLRDHLNKEPKVVITAIARELACFCWGILTGNVA